MSFEANEKPEKPEKPEVPKYKHNCKKCLFLGSWESIYEAGNRSYDLYFCYRYPESPTLMAKFSDASGDFHMGLSFIGLIPSITEAAIRVVKRFKAF